MFSESASWTNLCGGVWGRTPEFFPARKPKQADHSSARGKPTLLDVSSSRSAPGMTWVWLLGRELELFLVVVVVAGAVMKLRTVSKNRAPI